MATSANDFPSFVMHAFSTFTTRKLQMPRLPSDYEFN